MGFCIAATAKTGNDSLSHVGLGANDAPREKLSLVGHEALLAMTNLADWVNRHGRTASTHEVYAGFAMGKYDNLTGDAMGDSRKIAYEVVVR